MVSGASHARMDKDFPVDGSDAVAPAIAGLRAEISLLRRAVERLTDERTMQVDYGPSLEVIAKRLEDIGVWARRVSERPALQLTPQKMASELAEAATSGREQDKHLLEKAAGTMNAAAARIDAMILRSRSAGDQRRELLHNRVAFTVAGMVLMAILPGAVARSLPVSWAVPERIAARMLGTDMRTAGQNMMARAEELDKHQGKTRDVAHPPPERR
ncbi:DUF6118 family protein [Sphingomonas sp. PL-96]|uniref:DUF6118 family protein n=1 Tax=Sphingomonas sp. PL-96 TaxID=2887201 RepID=UPI001E36CB6E|nr:DUF6118 family protein [Sphingomonas sp. PL-96]MCC2976649.1 DUF6118 family protein [Sphingomonas sp. PL-96]